MQRIVLLAFGLLAAAATAAQDEACLTCHGDKDLKAASGKSLHVNAATFPASVHGAFGCASCHVTIQDYPHPRNPPMPDCSACHAETLGAYQRSVHFKAGTNGDRSSPKCISCHGSAHEIVPRSELQSLVHRRNLPATCGACHANPEFLAAHKIPFAWPVEAFKLSVHGRALERGNARAASCADCHASHETLPARDPQSKINHWNVPQTCGACHQTELKIYAQSVHGTAVARGVPGAPVCTDCHGEHSILAPSEPQSLVHPARVSSVTCGRCHNDERLTRRYNLPADKVPAFEDSFHGLAMRSGSQTVANCASCHGVHNILPSSDARSTIHPANLGKTCGACHPGAGERFTIERVHVRPAGASEHPAVKWIRLTYLFALIPLTLAFMLLHNLLDYLAKLRRGTPRPAVTAQVPRMNLNFRIAHGMVMVSFPILVITGFALRYPEESWAAPLLLWESSFGFRGWVHRGAGVLLVISLLYHFVHVIVVKRDRAMLRHMLPRWTDARDLVQLVRFNIGQSAERPHFGKFSYAEKVEYGAFIWGTVVMAVSGFLLWFNNFTLQNFPKWVSDAATAIHFYEAILATFSILLWHFYLVIFDPDVYPMEMAWLTGKVSAEHLQHTRPAYYAALLRALREEEEQRQARAAEEERRRRQKQQHEKEKSAPPGPADQHKS
jgi:cytochrome b subunit of formate dehydrogenase